MREPKSFASLSPTLLARKGGAKPAMRPQWQPLVDYSTEVPLPPHPDHLEDLGWDDMGEEAVDSTVVPFGAPDEQLQQSPLTAGMPEVLRQQDALAGHVGDEGRSEPSSLIPLAAHRYARDAAGKAESASAAAERRSALADGRRAAFTLRVDEVRHLKLRLACTMQGRSAQQLVTQALDRLLEELPELDDLAKRVRRR
ncbi:hypothetical protein [Novosphingobium sp. Gsoil 351]|uniref:hypothetical protein n=1 Tax=Novosphingobium sp. Gsoil 351 TaxID=2675225 RepID=UPI0012B498AA|nr:hypothetical protein [Novosphingobium sp. Gsoil 351]QGN54519.1 hypothetical protein GKE62_08050 [Novosphingobium sp. Gsoil 351]